MKTIATGLVGYGLGGSIFHAPLILAVPQLHLSAVMTSQRQRVEADLPGVPVVPNVEALLSDPSIELVVISSPSNTHFSVGWQSLSAGKHVVIDKPFAGTVSEAEQLIHLARDRGLFLSAYQNRRWDGDFLTVQQLIRDGLLGNIMHYEAHFDRYRLDIRTGWRETGGRGSGILYDLGAHLIDQAVHLFGLPQAVTADVFAQRKGAQAPDYFHLSLDYRYMRAILHGATVVRQPGPRFAIHGDRGSFLKFGLDPQEDQLKAGLRPGQLGWGIEDTTQHGALTNASGDRATIVTAAGCYEAYYQQVAAAIAGGAPNPVDPTGARDGLIVIEAALRSSAERRTVAIL